MDMSDKQPGNADASIPENHERTDDSWLPDEGEVKRLPRLKSKQKVRKLVIISVAVALVIAFAAWQLLPRLLNSGQEEQQQQRLSAAEIESTIVGTIALVSKDSHAISGGGQAVDVEISLANPGALSSGMSVTAKVETGARQIEGLETGTLEYAETKALRASSSGTVDLPLSATWYHKEQVVAANNLSSLLSRCSSLVYGMHPSGDRVEGQYIGVIEAYAPNRFAPENMSLSVYNQDTGRYATQTFSFSPEFPVASLTSDKYSPGDSVILLTGRDGKIIRMYP